MFLPLLLRRSILSYRTCYEHFKLQRLEAVKYREKCHSLWMMRFYKYSTLSVDRSTIFALSTASGTSAIAIVRISGPCASEALFKMGHVKRLPEERKATLCSLRDPETKELLDKALCLWFPSPNSFTGEDLCEFHIHGGIAVIKSILKALQKLPYFRFAEAGEFTKRAFIAGKLDLTEVEGLADLLHAETEAQQRQALRQMDGALYKLYSDWTGRVKKCLARLEAYIDFSEDQHVDDAVLKLITTDLNALKSEMLTHLQDKGKGEKLRNGVFTVLVGKPNVGKSSLLNILCKRDIAIVSSTAGTTRDIIESSLNLDGYLVNICDTAGIRDTSDSVELEGVNRAKDRFSKADLVIFITEAQRTLELLKSCLQKDIFKHLMENELGMTFSSKTIHPSLPNSFDSPKGESDSSPPTLLLINKVDLLSQKEIEQIKALEKSTAGVCAISCTNGTGMNTFVNMFAEKVNELCCGHRGEEPAITQERHRHCVRACYQNLCDYEECFNLDAAIAAEKLRCSINELGKITGKVSTEDILEVIFKDFCIGK